MTIVVTGLNHHTSPLALRERLMLPSDQTKNVLGMLRGQFGANSGVLILSTCNRIEIYVCAAEKQDVLHRRITTFLGAINRLAESEFAGFLYHYSNRDAVTHLFRVASSLDSMVVGENEILGQLNNAYETAQSAAALNRTMAVLFQRALKCGKKVRTETKIGAGKVSVASVAVDLAESILKDLSGKTAMIVGSGQISELALKSLVEHGVGKVMVLNRTLENARTLAGRYKGEAIILDAIPCHLHRADIVISSTGAPDLILRRVDFERAIEKRGRAPMFVIDIAVPRDIEREAAHVDNVYCYDMDDLQGLAERNLQNRQKEIGACNAIINAEVQSFIAWRLRQNMEPLVVELTRYFHGVREQEVQRTLKKLNGLQPEEKQEIENLANRIVNSLLHKPIQAIKAASGENHNEALVDIAQHIFGIRDTEQ